MIIALLETRDGATKWQQLPSAPCDYPLEICCPLRPKFEELWTRRGYYPQSTKGENRTYRFRRIEKFATHRDDANYDVYKYEEI